MEWERKQPKLEGKGSPVRRKKIKTARGKRKGKAGKFGGIFPI